MIPQKRRYFEVTTGVEFETGRIIDGKKEYKNIIEYDLGTEIKKTIPIDENISNMRIDVRDSYIVSNNFILPVCQYHTTEDWSRAYCSTVPNNKGRAIFIEFGDVYSQFYKIARIAILYTKD